MQARTGGKVREVRDFELTAPPRIAAISHNEAGLLLFDGPRRREAVGGHDDKSSPARAKTAKIFLERRLRYGHRADTKSWLK
jgi:hypothetical protein